MPPRRPARWRPDMPEWTRPGHALRPRRRRRIVSLAASAAVLGSLWLAAWLDPLPPRFSGAAIAADGDSLRLGTDRIRLVGIDAPELTQVCWDASGAEWPCGRAAHRALADRVAIGSVTCQPEGTDRYGRTLARCSIAGEDLGAALVGAGLALARGGYRNEERAARSAGLGLWQGRFVDPRRWRDDGPTADPGAGALENLWTWFRQLTGARTLR